MTHTTAAKAEIISIHGRRKYPSNDALTSLHCAQANNCGGQVLVFHLGPGQIGPKRTRWFSKLSSLAAISRVVPDGFTLLARLL